PRAPPPPPQPPPPKTKPCLCEASLPTSRRCRSRCCILRVLVRDQRRHRPVIRRHILLCHSLHIRRRHRVDQLFFLVHMLPSAEILLGKPDRIGPSRNRLQLPIIVRDHLVLGLGQLLPGYRRVLQLLKLRIDRRLHFLR